MTTRGPAWVSVAVGSLVILVGLVWTGQGAGLIGGSFMSGSGAWVVLGLVAVVIGALVVVRALRVRPTR